MGNCISKVPVVELADCTLCGGCMEVCPRVFRLNDAGYVEVAELPCYPKEEVDEAIMICPGDCIHWEKE